MSNGDQSSGSNPQNLAEVLNQLFKAEKKLNAQPAVEELLRLLSSIRQYEESILQALTAFGIDPDHPKNSAPVSRAEALKNFMIEHSDLTIRVVDVPRILNELGLRSQQAKPQTNWLYAKGSKAHALFDVRNGIVRLRPGISGSQFAPYHGDEPEVS